MKERVKQQKEMFDVLDDPKEMLMKLNQHYGNPLTEEGLDL